MVGGGGGGGSVGIGRLGRTGEEDSCEVGLLALALLLDLGALVGLEVGLTRACVGAKIGAWVTG